MIVAEENRLDYFMQDIEGVFAGLHLILDLYEVTRLDELERIKSGLIAAAEVAGANVLHAHMHHFGEDQGVSGVVVLAESHLSVHSWPECGYMAIDVFMCGNTQPKKAVDFLVDYFQAGRHECSILRRGSKV